MHAAKVLGLRAAMPDAAQELAGPVLGPLRERKAPDEVEALRAAGAAIDRVHERMAEWLRPGRTEREVGRDIAEAILAEGHASVDFTIVGSGPNGASPHHEVSDRVIGVRRAGGGRHRRHHRGRLLLRLHPDIRAWASRRPSSPRTTRCCRRPSRRRWPRSARACRPSRSTRPPGP